METGAHRGGDSCFSKLLTWGLHTHANGSLFEATVVSFDHITLSQIVCLQSVSLFLRLVTETLLKYARRISCQPPRFSMSLRGTTRVRQVVCQGLCRLARTTVPGPLSPVLSALWPRWPPLAAPDRLPQELAAPSLRKALCPDVCMELCLPPSSA